MNQKVKPYAFCARLDERKPFKVQIEPKGGTIVTGLFDYKTNYFYRFTRPVVVKKGDIFIAAPKKGLILNGKLVERKIIQPKGPMPVKMGWAPEKLRLAVFLDRDRTWSKKFKRLTKKPGRPYWCAMDLRGYWVGTGKTPQEAMDRLISTVRATDEMQREEEKKGLKVIRWHCERESRDYLAGIEKLAKKNGFILDGVEWRKAFFAKKLATAVGS